MTQLIKEKIALAISGIYSEQVKLPTGEMHIPFQRAIGALQELESQLLTELQSDGWISVHDERKPKFGESVSVYLPNYRVPIQTATYDKVFATEFVISAICVTRDVTHWRPLPNPPKQ